MDYFAHVSERRIEDVNSLKRLDVRRAVSKFSRVCWSCWRMLSVDAATSLLVLLLLYSALLIGRIAR